MNANLESEVTQLHAEICAGLADPNRILILYELSQSPRNVTELSTNLKMPQPLVSRHLKVLRERGMVIPKRLGTVIQYTLADKRLIQALDLLRAVMRDGLTKRAELTELREAAIDLGVRLMPCQMSMDVMEINCDHLIPETTEPVGVATMLEHAKESSIHFFI